MKRLEAFQTAQKKLASELSVHHLLIQMRLTDFIADYIGISNY